MLTSTAGQLEKQFGARVRRVRQTKGVAQVELARLANVSRSAVVNLESGAGSSLATIAKVLDALGCSDWLLSLEVPDGTFNPLDLLDRPEPEDHGPGRQSRPLSAAPVIS